MNSIGEAPQPLYLTTREVADLLRVKERKVYDLAAAGEIPHRRITGKLLFPHSEVMTWINGSGDALTPVRPAVLTGSHDPLLDWAIRESGSGLATIWNGSRDGLNLYAGNQAALTGMHIPETDGWNIDAVKSQNPTGCVLISWARRARGLVLSKAAAPSIHQFCDIVGKRVVMRQPGAGAATLFDTLLSDAGLSTHDFLPSDDMARTESDAAALVSAGLADAAMGIEAMAAQYHLGFVKLCDERFDLLVDRRAFFSAPIQQLFAFARSDAFIKKAENMGGYDIETLGDIRWVSA